MQALVFWLLTTTPSPTPTATPAEPLVVPVQERSSAVADDTAAPTLTGRHWAVSLDRPGLPNLHQVSASVYRGAQPEAAGFPQLRKLGIKTVVNLRAFHDDEPQARKYRLSYAQIPVKEWEPTLQEAAAFLKTVTDESAAPFYVHCKHGADHTGVMIAVYRVAVQGWTKEEAVREMTQGSFGFHDTWKDLVTWVRELDVDALRSAAGLDVPSQK